MKSKKSCKMPDNKTNRAFYEDKSSLNILKNSADLTGMSACNDLLAIKKLILSSKNILEIGAGYGRVITALLDYGYQGNITAVERSQVLYNCLCNEFPQDKVTLINSDLKNLNHLGKFDLVLWLWSGISEFSPKEHFSIIKSLFKHVHVGGYLVIDILLSKPINTNSKQGKYAFIRSESGAKYSAYLVSLPEMENYARQLGHCKIKTIQYKTASGRDRLLCKLLKFKRSL